MIFLKMALRNGEVLVRLFPEIAPKCVGGIMSLVKGGYYSGLFWEPASVEQGFARTGCPFGRGNGAVVAAWPLETSHEIKHVRGAVSLPSVFPDTYVGNALVDVHFRDAPELDGKRTIIGQVVHGLPALEKLCTSPREERYNLFWDLPKI